MYSELVVLVISGKEDLTKSWHFVEKKHASSLFRLVDIVLIQNDGTDQISYQMRRNEIDRSTDTQNDLAAAFAEAIFDDSRAEDRQQLVAAGLDPFFVRQVTQALIQDSLAYLIHLPRESLIDSRRFLDVLEEQPGDLYHTTFRPRVEEVLLKLNA